MSVSVLEGPAENPVERGEVEARRLEAEIAEVCGVLNASTARLVNLIRQVLATEAWMGAGIRSAEQWVAWQCGVSPGRARALVLMARRLPDLPVAAAAFGAGELAEDQVGVVCRHAETRNDAEVTELARNATVSQLRRALRTTPPAPDPTPGSADADGQPPAPEPRNVSFGFSDDGASWTMTVRGPSDIGALIQRALEDARQWLFHQAEDDAGRSDVDWLAALALMAERSLDLTAGLRPHRDRYPAMLHLDSGPDGRPTGHLHGGPALPDSLRRYLSCDGHLRAVQEVDGVPVSVGRSSRTVPDRVRILVEERDRGCRVPGCDRHRWLHIHHIVHWEDGGTTDFDNLISLCERHHRLHHQGLLGITGNPNHPNGHSNGVVFTDHRGRPLAGSGRPTPPPPDQPPAATAARLGIRPGTYTHPTGEQLHTKWITFNDPPHQN